MLKKNTTTTTVQLAWKLLFLGSRTVLKLWSIGGKTRKKAQPAYDDITLMTSIGMQSWLLLGKWRYQTDRKKRFLTKAKCFCLRFSSVPRNIAWQILFRDVLRASLRSEWLHYHCSIGNWTWFINQAACLPASRQTIGLAGPDQPMASTY